MIGLQPVLPAEEGASQRPSDASGGYRDQEKTYHGEDQLFGQAFWLLQKVEGRLHLRIIGTRRNLLEGFKRLLANLPTGLQHREGDGGEDGDYRGTEKSGHGTELCSGAGIGFPGWMPGAVKNDGQTSSAQNRQQRNHQAQRHHYN